MTQVTMIGAATPGPQYVVTTDGTIVTAWDDAGLQQATGGDLGAVVGAIMPARNSRGVTIALRNNGQLFPQATPIPLPAGITGRLVLDGYGATVQIAGSSTSPRFTDFNKQADGDSFQNITWQNLTIDCNNTGGQHHVVCGTYQAGTVQSRINFANLEVDNVRTINVPTDSTLTNHRLNVFLQVNMPAASAATTVSNIRVTRVRFEGGNAGINVSATGATASSCTLSDIYIDRWYHTLGAVQATGFSSENVQVGSSATTINVYVGHGHGLFSGDVGVEIDNALDAVVEKVEIDDAFNNCFYFTNFTAPADLNAQLIQYRSCTGKKLTVTAGACNGFAVSQQNANAIGTVQLDGCKYNGSETTTTTGRGVSFTVGALAYEFRDCKFTRDGWTNVTNNQLLRMVLIQSTGTTTRVVMENVETLISGTSSGAATGWNVSTVFLDGGTFVLDIARCKFNTTITSSPANVTVHVNLAPSTATTFSGRLSETIFANTGDGGPDAVLVNSNATISPLLECERNDFMGLATTAFANVFVVVTAATKNNIRIRGNFYRTNPVPVNFTGLVTATGKALGTMFDCIATFTQGSGVAVTAVDYSMNGGTTFTNFLTQASGALPAGFDQSLGPLTSDAQLKATFTTTQPTITLVPVNP